MNRKEIIARYKGRPITGGVYRIINTKNGKYLLTSGIDLRACENRFNFSVATGSCVQMKLQKDWDKFGEKAFTFEILDEIKKKPDQELKEFTEDLKTLEEIWRDRLDGDEY